MPENMLDIVVKYKLEAEVKFHYYLLGLTATTLAFSIQFMVPEEHNSFGYFLFIAWAAFSLSIVFGILWQTYWIKELGALHSSLLDTTLQREKKSPAASPLTVKLVYSEIAQSLFFFIGLGLLAASKILSYLG